MKRLAALFGILLGVSACEQVAGNVALVVLGADMSTLMFTGKTILDHGVSARTGKNCSLLNAENREPYCQEWVEQGESLVMLYCYPTLGQPDCYLDPLPNRPGRYTRAVANPEI